MEVLRIIKSTIASDSRSVSVILETDCGPLELGLNNALFDSIFNELAAVAGSAGTCASDGKPVAGHAPAPLKVQANKTDQRVVLSIRSTSGLDQQIALAGGTSRFLGERILDAAIKCGAYSDSSYCI